MRKSNRFFYTSALAGFAGLSLVFTNCSSDSFKLAQAASNSAAQAGAGSQVPLTGDDPFMTYAWHLKNSGQRVFASTAGVAGVDLNLTNTWAQNYLGNGIKIQVSDSGLEDTHEDLTANFSYTSESKDYTLAEPYLATTAPPKSADDNHGTSVAGLIAAARNNGLGSSGVAPKSKITSANFLSTVVTQTIARFIDQANGDFDISNMSWGTNQNTLSPITANYEAQLKYMVTNKRNGRGTIFVKASGNSFYVYCRGSQTAVCIGNSNFDGDDTNPYTLVVGAANASGKASSYSSPGSNLWITSFGGEFGDDSPAMITTDRTGCALGYAKNNSGSNIPFQNGLAGNTSCSYTSTFNGTSSASPLISGSVALLLQANPNLTWRDVKYILAKTATTVDYQTVTGINHPLNTPVPAGYTWELPWVQNSAGFRFHNWYGFGRVNVDAAVTAARSYASTLGTYTETNWAHTISGIALAIPDNSAAGIVSTMNVTQNLKAESVQVSINVTHPDVSDLAVELTSPSGTKSILVNMRNSLTGLANYQGEVFLSNAFYQENIQGNWSLKIIDGKAGSTGTLTRWSLNFTGAP